MKREPKPPIGVMPESIWRSKRIEELVDALGRRRAEACPIDKGQPLQWAIECAQHAEWLRMHNQVEEMVAKGPLHGLEEGRRNG